MLAAATLAIALVGTACLPPAPPPPPPPPPAPASPPGGSSYEAITKQKIHQLVNQHRANAGLPPLSWSSQLAQLAQDWSANMAVYGFRHNDLNGVIRSPGFSHWRTLGENILHGPSSMDATAMVNAWMNSPGHRGNILSGAFTHGGVGVHVHGNQVFVTHNFGG